MALVLAGVVLSRYHVRYDVRESDDEKLAEAVLVDTTATDSAIVDTTNYTHTPNISIEDQPISILKPDPGVTDEPTNNVVGSTRGLRDIDPRELASTPSLRKEALLLLSNRLEETDSACRHKILNYCEHLRTSYTTKDIDFLRQVFSDNALIIVGTVVKTGKKWDDAGGDTRVHYAVRTKHEYLERLEKVFATNDKIQADFADFRIMRHPSVEGIYGVTLRQHYSTSRYSDDGYLFLLWDFRNPSMPLIHVRTWQPYRAVETGEEVIDISDFNLE